MKLRCEYEEYCVHGPDMVQRRAGRPASRRVQYRVPASVVSAPPVVDTTMEQHHHHHVTGI